MFRKEITDALKSKRTILFIVIILALMLIDLYMVYEDCNVAYKRENKAEIIEMDNSIKELAQNSEDKIVYVSNWILHPAKASFLSGSSHGHLAQIILLWLMPLFVLNLYSDKYISEYGRGYMNSIITRMSRKKICLSKICASFAVPAIVYIISLLVNFLLAHLLFYEGNTFNGTEVFKENGGFFTFMYENPNTTYILYIVMTGIAAGFCGVICQCLSLILKRYIVVYLAAFFIWMGLVIIKNGIINMFQPFTEYGLEYILKAVLLLITVTLCMLVIMYVMGATRKDEL